MSTFNWGDLTQAAADAGFSLVPKGTHTVVVHKAEAKKTGTGKDKINVQFKVVGGPSNGASLFNDFVISPENGTALGFFFRHMKALGLGPDYFKANPTLSQVAKDLVGKQCQVEVGIRIWNEEERNEITKVMALPGGTVPVAPTGQPVPGGQPMPGGQPVAATVSSMLKTPTPAAAPQPAVAPQPTPQPAPAAQPAVAAPTPAAAPSPVVDSSNDEEIVLPPETPF